MLVVELLRMRLFVVDDAERCHVVNHLAGVVNEEQVVTTVVASVAIFARSKKLI